MPRSMYKTRAIVACANHVLFLYKQTVVKDGVRGMSKSTCFAL